jgi:hypothetical protein
MTTIDERTLNQDVDTDTTVRWWHYTLGRTLVEIVASQRIKRAASFVQGGERRAVWFSCSTEWEPTATKGRLETRTGERRAATIEEMLVAGGALVRLEVPETVARYTWADHRRIGQIDPRIADALACAPGAEPGKWRVSYHDVPIQKVLSIEASTDGRAWRLVGEGSPNGVMVDSAFADLLRRSAR